MNIEPTPFPLVSCIITSYNSQNSIIEAIESVLSQTYPNLELIIVDDHSTDQTFSLIEKFKTRQNVHIFRHDVNSGLPAVTRNTGIKHVKGDYVAFLDADDLWMHDKIEKQMAIIQNPDLDIVAVGSTMVFSENVTKIRTVQRDVEISLNDILWSNSVPLSSLLFTNLNIFFNEEKKFRAVEDLEFQVRLIKESGKKIFRFGEALVYYSIEEGSISSNFENYSNLLNVIEQYRDDLSKESYSQAMHIAYIKLGLKAMKLETDSYIFMKKSVPFHGRSISRLSISLVLLLLSSLPKSIISNLLGKAYSFRKFSRYLFNKLTS